MKDVNDHYPEIVSGRGFKAGITDGICRCPEIEEDEVSDGIHILCGGRANIDNVFKKKKKGRAK